MLDSLSIKNFRLFKELTIERLGRVNLIVGKNNSGKTAFLEALLIYASNASLLDVLISQRSENWEIETSARNQVQPDDNPLRHLFYQRHFPEFADAGIEIGSLNDLNQRVTLRTRYYQIVEHEEGVRHSKLVVEGQSDTLFFEALIQNLTIDVEPRHSISKIPNLLEAGAMFSSDRYLILLAHSLNSNYKDCI